MFIDHYEDTRWEITSYKDNTYVVCKKCCRANYNGWICMSCNTRIPEPVQQLRKAYSIAHKVTI